MYCTVIIDNPAVLMDAVEEEHPTTLHVVCHATHKYTNTL